MAVRRSAGVLRMLPSRPASGPTTPIATLALPSRQTRTIFESLLTSAFGSCEARSMSHSKVLPYSPTTVFKTVSDVGGYPNFLPLTISSRVKARDKAGYPTRASLKVGSTRLGVEEDWESIVRCDPAKGIIEAKSSDEHSSGLFETLSTKWQIAPSKTTDASTAVKLDVTVKFRNPVYDQMFAQVEAKVASTMISAFEKRVQELQQRQEVKP